MSLQERLCSWENIRLAYQNASRGKRGREATAAFELLLADNLLELQGELSDQTYRPGGYSSFYIHEPKNRLISAAPFRDRVVHHTVLAGIWEDVGQIYKSPATWASLRCGTNFTFSQIIWALLKSMHAKPC